MIFLDDMDISRDFYIKEDIENLDLGVFSEDVADIQETYGNFSESVLNDKISFNDAYLECVYLESVGSVWEGVKKFFKAILEFIQKVFRNIKNFFLKLFGKGNENPQTVTKEYEKTVPSPSSKEETGEKVKITITRPVTPINSLSVKMALLAKNINNNMDVFKEFFNRRMNKVPGRILYMHGTVVKASDLKVLDELFQVSYTKAFDNPESIINPNINKPTPDFINYRQSFSKAMYYCKTDYKTNKTVKTLKVLEDYGKNISEKPSNIKVVENTRKYLKEQGEKMNKFKSLTEKALKEAQQMERNPKSNDAVAKNKEIAKQKAILTLLKEVTNNIQIVDGQIVKLLGGGVYLNANTLFAHVLINMGSKNKKKLHIFTK